MIIKRNSFGIETSHIKGIIIGITTGIGIIILGIAIRNTKELQTQKVKFTVVSVSTNYFNKNQYGIVDSVNLPTNITYNIGGTIPECGDKIMFLIKYRTKLSIGETIDVYMRPGCKNDQNNKNIVITSIDDNSKIGIGMIIGGVVLIIYVIVRTILLRRRKV